MSKLYIYEHKGYTLQQSSLNWHCMIFDTKGEPVYHASCTEKLTEAEAKEMIDNFLIFRRSI